jgi:hypothetical protein
METNILSAIYNVVNNPIIKPVVFYKSKNRVNSVGEGLELYIKDIFCDSLDIDDLVEKLKKHSNTFSYLGNQNNPPDIMIRGGDAIEVKKIESKNSGIALNSSYPKNKLLLTNPMITTDCKKAEDWTEKDLLYVVGSMKDAILSSLWFVYGDCFCADSEIYEKTRSKIISGLEQMSDIEFAETKELGRVNRVDPLGITYLRVRGMWGIQNPFTIFNYLTLDISSNFTLNAIMLNSKYDSFSKESKNQIEQIDNKNFKITDVEIKSPNNPAKLLKAKHITFSV